MDISGFRGAQIGFLDNFLQSVDRVISIGQDIFVHLLHGIVVVFDGLLDFVGGVFGVLQTPGFGVALGADGLVVGLGVGSGVVRSGMVGQRSVVGSGMVGSGSVGVVVGSVMGSGVMGSVGVRVVGSGAVRHWSVAVGGGSGGVTVSVMRQWVGCGCGCGGSGDQS